jgi:hypothetical protein
MLSGKCKNKDYETYSGGYDLPNMFSLYAMNAIIARRSEVMWRGASCYETHTGTKPWTYLVNTVLLESRTPIL